MYIYIYLYSIQVKCVRYPILPPSIETSGTSDKMQINNDQGEIPDLGPL